MFSNKNYFNLSLLILFFTLSACGGGGGSSSPSVSQGVFVDSAVEGITYTSGNQSGLTDANGSFSYETGKTVTFSIGGIVIGTVSGSAIVTPVQLVANATDQTDPVVTNIVQFLMTIDDDHDPSNGIKITQAIRDVATSLSVDFTLTDFDNDGNVSSVIDTLTTESAFGNRALVDATVAQNHLSDSLFSLMAGTYSGSFTGTDSGTWSANIATDGSISGSGNSNTVGAISITGSVTTSGTTAATATGSAGNSSWTGNINITNGSLTGTWAGGADSGTFSGSKQ